MPRAGGAIATIAFVGVAAAAVVWGPGLYADFTDHPASNRCTVSADTGSYSLSPEQANNAAIIATVGWVYGADEQGVTVALATAIQESGLRNLDYGDRDSVGLFQQRTSQGWGTIEQIMDPRYSAAMFYLGLAKVDGWQDLPVTEAAQAVQRSGFPDAYADHEDEGRVWANALGGIEGVMSCDLSAPEAATAQALSERVGLDFPNAGFGVDVIDYEGTTTVLGVRPPDASDQSLRRLQAWAIATSSTTGVTWADFRGELWNRDGSRVVGYPTSEWAAYPGVRLGLETG